MIVCNSLIAVHKSLTSRAKSRPTPGALTSTDKEATGSVESDTEIPVFSCKVTLNGPIITISPNLDKFDEGFRNLLTKLDEAVQSVPVLFQDVIFNPYTQPILYGKMENYRAESENFPFVHGHEESCEAIMMQIRQALVEAFEVCDLGTNIYIFSVHDCNTREILFFFRNGDVQSYGLRVLRQTQNGGRRRRTVQTGRC